jgi:hypothetical protein
MYEARHRHQEFIRFLNVIDAQVPKKKKVHATPLPHCSVRKKKSQSAGCTDPANRDFTTSSEGLRAADRRPQPTDRRIDAQKIAAPSVQAIAVAAAPVLYARATGIECRKGAIRMSNGCAPS